MVDTLRYVVKMGCLWRQLPADFPPLKPVHERFRRWRDSGLWERVGQAFREQGRPRRGAVFRQEWPSSIRSRPRAPVMGPRGYGAGKKIKGRKRHIAVDTPGKLLTTVVHSAGIQDRVGVRAVSTRLLCRFDTIFKVFVDGGQHVGRLLGWPARLRGPIGRRSKASTKSFFRKRPF